MDERVSIQAHFERFPATVKGAFVLRAADREPHQVRIDAARVREMSGLGAFPIGLDPVTLDVAPKLDLFVPFEFAITELVAGWYDLECDVAIDGDKGNVRPPKRFAVPWPRATVRRGTLKVDKISRVEAGPKVHVEQVECGGEMIRVVYSVSPAEEVTMGLAADDAPLLILESEFDQETGSGRVTAYPLMRTHSRLTIDIPGVPASIELHLP